MWGSVYFTLNFCTLNLVTELFIWMLKGFCKEKLSTFDISKTWWEYKNNFNLVLSNLFLLKDLCFFLNYCFADQGAAKPAFSFLNSSSSSSSTPATSSSASIFGSSTSSSSPPVAAFVFGQASNPVSSSAFGNSAESSTSQPLLFPQDGKPATTSSTASAAPPFVFGTGASSNSTVSSGFTFGATTTSSSSGTFVLGGKT